MTKNAAKILNIAAYKFVELTDKRLIQLQKECESLSKKLNLKGTILLSTEGINLFFAGTQQNIELFWERLVSHIEFFNLAYKARPRLNDRHRHTDTRLTIKPCHTDFASDDICSHGP